MDSEPEDRTVTYVVTVDSKYFLGAVGLMNSLRLTGHQGAIVVNDVGLTDYERAILSKTCEIRRLPSEGFGLPVFSKTGIHEFGLTGTIVLLDCDMIITSDLTPVLREAAVGQICVFGSSDDPRYFPEWADLFHLRSPLRRAPYVNNGFVALRADLWQDRFLRRWHEVCDLVRAERSRLPQFLGDDDSHPLAYPTQDPFNALLMSEIPGESVTLFDIGLATPPNYEATTRVVDSTSLKCTNGSETPFLLHYWDKPKPWSPDARTTLHFDAYVDLLARTLDADDLPLRVSRKELPIWLRQDHVGRLVRRAPRSARRTTRKALTVLPEPFERRATALVAATAHFLHFS